MASLGPRNSPASRRPRRWSEATVPARGMGSSSSSPAVARPTSPTSTTRSTSFVAPGEWGRASRRTSGAATRARDGAGAAREGLDRRDGRETGPVGARALHARRPPQRPRSGRGDRRGGFAALERRGAGQGPGVVAPPESFTSPDQARGRLPDPGSDRDVLSASPALASVGRHTSRGPRLRGPNDEGVSGSAGRGVSGSRGASRRVASQQAGGMRPPRGANAASETSEDDAGLPDLVPVHRCSSPVAELVQ